MVLSQLKEVAILNGASLGRVLTRKRFFLRAVTAAHCTRRGKAIRQQKIWLFGGSSGKKYADNSAALHKYVCQHHPEIDARWVISRSSPDVEVAKAHGKVLVIEDPDSFLYGLLAEVHVVSHGVHDVPSCASKFSRALKVRLGHGITALVKRKPPHRFQFNSLDPIFDLVPVSSDFEADNKLDWGFAKEKLAVTGVARFDELLEMNQNIPPATNPRRILYMPTARDWLVGRPSLFETSDYKQSIAAFLSGVNEHLAAHDVRMWVFVHPLMWEHFEVMNRLSDLSQVDLLPLNADFQQALVRSGLLITDYSSVAWDALYIDRPTLFYQFDCDEFYKHRGQGSHLDLTNDLFGPRALNSKAAVGIVRKYIRSQFSALGYENQMRRWQRLGFIQIDTHNRERIFNTILSYLNKGY
jgi:CDP-glycerol glycerophosphotransferase (TagB/SpsB family)